MSLTSQMPQLLTSPMTSMTLLQMTLTEQETPTSPMTLMLTSPVSPMSPIQMLHMTLMSR